MRSDMYDRISEHNHRSNSRTSDLYSKLRSKLVVNSDPDHEYLEETPEFYSSLRRVQRNRDWQSPRTGHRDFKIGPLESYLNSHIGENWNDIYSDMCKVLGNTFIWKYPFAKFVDNCLISKNVFIGEDGRAYELQES